MTVWYVVLCRTCNEEVKAFGGPGRRGIYVLDHKKATGHTDFWYAETGPREH